MSSSEKNPKVQQYENKMKIGNLLLAQQEERCQPLLAGNLIEALGTSQPKKVFNLGGYVESESEMSSVAPGMGGPQSEEQSSSNANQVQDQKQVSQESSSNNSRGLDFKGKKRRRVPSNPESLQQRSSKNSGRSENDKVESRSSALNSESQESSDGHHQAQFDGFDTVPFEDRRGILNMGQASRSLSVSANHEPNTNSSLISQNLDDVSGRDRRQKQTGSFNTPKRIRNGFNGTVRVTYDTLRQSQEFLSMKRKCQVDSSCHEIAIGICSEREYRGCTMAFCNDHSGQQNFRQKKCCCSGICAKDQHVDICSECSNDILQAKRRFYCITSVLSVIFFSVGICLLHVILQALPGLCPVTDTSMPTSSFCNTIHQLWHDVSIYDRRDFNSPSTGQAANETGTSNEDIIS